jgi:hypothetical protein
MSRSQIVDFSGMVRNAGGGFYSDPNTGKKAWSFDDIVSD